MAVHEGRGAVVAAWVVMGALAAAGCSSSPFQAQQDLAEQNIVRAEETGVGDDLDQARDLLDEAKDAEERALDEREDASDDLADARKDGEEAKGRVSAREERLQHTMNALTAAETEVEPVEAELQAMRDRGLSPSEAHALVGPRLQLLRQRVVNYRYQRRAQELELELGRLEQQSAEARAAAAEAQLRAAEERLQLASALYDLTSQRAETLELELLTNQHKRMRDRLQELRPK